MDKITITIISAIRIIVSVVDIEFIYLLSFPFLYIYNTPILKKSQYLFKRILYTFLLRFNVVKCARPQSDTFLHHSFYTFLSPLSFFNSISVAIEFLCFVTMSISSFFRNLFKAIICSIVHFGFYLLSLCPSPLNSVKSSFLTHFFFTSFCISDAKFSLSVAVTLRNKLFRRFFKRISDNVTATNETSRHKVNFIHFLFSFLFLII